MPKKTADLSGVLTWSITGVDEWDAERLGSALRRASNRVAHHNHVRIRFDGTHRVCELCAKLDF